MSYNEDNPPQAIVSVPKVQGGTRSLWVYESTDDGAAVDADGYISNGQDLGMKQGDIVFVIDTSDYAVTSHAVRSLSTSDQSVDLGDGTTVGSTAYAD